MMDRQQLVVFVGGFIDYLRKDPEMVDLTADDTILLMRMAAEKMPKSKLFQRAVDHPDFERVHVEFEDFRLFYELESN